jgi:hypothetical protein
MTDYQTRAHSEVQDFPILVDTQGEAPGPGEGCDVSRTAEVVHRRRDCFCGCCRESGPSKHLMVRVFRLELAERCGRVLVPSDEAQSYVGLPYGDTAGMSSCRVCRCIAVTR